MADHHGNRGSGREAGKAGVEKIVTKQICCSNRFLSIYSIEMAKNLDKETPELNYEYSFLS